MSEMPKELQEKREEIVKKCYHREEYAERDAFRSGFDDCYKIMSQEIESRIESYNKLDDVNIRLNELNINLIEKIKKQEKIIAKEFNENDEFGSEFVYVRILKDEIAKLNEKLKIAIEALEEIGNEQFYNRWDCDGGEYKCEIAREALDKLKKEIEA